MLFISTYFAYLLLLVTATAGLRFPMVLRASRTSNTKSADQSSLIAVAKNAERKAIQFVRFKSLSPRPIYLWELDGDEQPTSDTKPLAGDINSTYTQCCKYIRCCIYMYLIEFQCLQRVQI